MQLSSRRRDHVLALTGAVCMLVLAKEQVDGQEIRALEKEPSALLAGRVTSAFAAADTITTRYLPSAGRLYAPVGRDDLKEGWKYSFAYRCVITCERAALEIQSYFSAGVRLESECPDRYYAVVELVRRDAVIADFYIQDGGHCFTLDDQSYYVEQSFDRFIQLSELFPRFVD